MLPTLVIVAVTGGAALGEAPPIQRPKSMAPEPVAPEPVAPAPIESPPTPIESAPTRVEPPQPIASEPVATEPVASEPPSPSASPTIAAPVESTEAPLGVPEDAPPRVPDGRPIPPAMRRPGIWVGVASGLFIGSAAMHAVIPALGQCECDNGSCNRNCRLNTIIVVSVLSLPVDAATMTIWGFAGRAYGLRAASGSLDAHALRRRRAGTIGAGAVAVASGLALTLGLLVGPATRDKPDIASWGYAAGRIGGVALGSIGAALLGYGVALPKPRSDGLARLRVAPQLSRTGAGVSLGLSW